MYILYKVYTSKQHFMYTLTIYRLNSWYILYNFRMIHKQIYKSNINIILVIVTFEDNGICQS